MLVEQIAICGFYFGSEHHELRATTPCGRCRQVLQEFSDVSGKGIVVLACNGNLSVIDKYLLSDLLPNSFGPKSIGIEFSMNKYKKNLMNRWRSYTR
jgi:cytidine deaminase